MSVLMLVVICGICGCSERDKESDMPPLCKSVETAVAAIVKLESASGVEGFVFKELDATDMTMEQFARELKTIDGEVHLWMPGHDRWLLVGRPESKKTSLSDVMEVFAFGDELTPVHEVFASYVGTRKDIEPAFIGVDMSAKARMEYFVTKEIPALPWLDATGSDGDIRRKVLSDIRSMQVVRRLIVEGDMIAENAVDKTKQSAAVDMWARAAKRNLQDPLLQERIERLERNAKVFLEAQKVLQAMKCYETILMISPNNAVAVHNFGICLKKLGKTELAAKALKRAEELSK